MVKWCKENYPHLRPRLREFWGDCRDYYLMQGAKGEQINWPAAFRRWVRRAHLGPRREVMPQEERTHKKAELRVVRDIFSKVKEK